MTTDELLERLRPHIDRLLEHDDLTSFELNGRLHAIGEWKITPGGRWDQDVIRTLRLKALKERQLTAPR